MSKVKDLQAVDLDTPEKLAKSKPETLKTFFEDEKVAKQIITAAKRVSKKRAAGEDTATSSPTAAAKKQKRKNRNESFFSNNEPLPPAELEESLQLPSSSLSAEELHGITLFTNRAPLVLAFLVILLKYTMPEQPLSSRLSLAQAYVSITSRSRAVYLGIESGKSAEAEGFGEGQPVVTVAGKEVKVLRRWGYEWREDGKDVEEEEGEEKPALWALDLEALKKGKSEKQPAAVQQVGNHGNLPIYTPQSARAYLMKSFDTATSQTEQSAAKKISAAARVAEKEQNLGKLLRAIDLLYESWAPILSPAELDSRTWTWYVKCRPAVEDGVAGWGGKNELRLSDILALCRGGEDVK